MVDELVLESIKISIGKIIVFWTELGYRYEGRIIAVSNEYLKYFDTHKQQERFIKLVEIKEAELDG